MGYLSDYEQDIFVSHAHSELNDWSKRLVEDTRRFVAIGLGLRDARQIGLWWDYKMSGHEPLTRQLRENVERSAVLVVLMSEWYLESSWCRDEREWFVNAVRQKRADRPVFLVRIRETDDKVWPSVFKDERGHPLVGYDFVRALEDDVLGLPKGYPRPEDAPDSKEYYDALSKLASDIVRQLKALSQSRPPSAPDPAFEMPDLAFEMMAYQRVCLAATPAEDVDDLREELAGLLIAQGCQVVPETNPLETEEIHEHAGEWIFGSDKFVQILGNTSGAWTYDKEGFVIYQYSIAQSKNKPIFTYRPPSWEASRVKNEEYREFAEHCDHDETGGLQGFAERIVRPAEPPPYSGPPLGSGPGPGGGGSRNVFIIASWSDRVLEDEIRRLLKKLDISALPLRHQSREIDSVLDEQTSFLEIVRRCDAILLINGNVKEHYKLWIEGRLADIKYDIQRKLGRKLSYVVVDAPPEPRLKLSAEIAVLHWDSPTLTEDLIRWLNVGAGPMAGHVA
jgi:TIR domain